MTLEQHVNMLLNKNYRPLDIMKAAKEIEKSAVASSAPTVSR